MQGFRTMDARTEKSKLTTTADEPSSQCASPGGAAGTGVCPVCRGVTLIEIRGKLQCSRCHVICETCCEGGRG